MSTKHTPGPWKSGMWGYVLDNQGYTVCRVEAWRKPDEVEANRRLVEMTPEMLKALEDIISSSDANCGDSLANAILHAKGVVAKAT